jgi:hypothetical protein
MTLLCFLSVCVSVCVYLSRNILLEGLWYRLAVFLPLYFFRFLRYPYRIMEAYEITRLSVCIPLSTSESLNQCLEICYLYHVT